MNAHTTVRAMEFATTVYVNVHLGGHTTTAASASVHRHAATTGSVSTAHATVTRDGQAPIAINKHAKPNVPFMALV